MDHTSQMVLIKTQEASLKNVISSKPTVDIKDKDSCASPKEIIDEYISSVTIHGVNKVYEANHIAVKCFWVAVFLTFFVLFALNVVTLVNKIHENQVRIEFRSVENQPMIFPTVYHM